MASCCKRWILRDNPTLPEADDTQEAPVPQRLAARTLRGMFWAYGSYAVGRVLVLISVAVLARLLSPDEFGLVALAIVFTTLMEVVKDLGVGQALVVSREDEVSERAGTAFAFSVLIGLVLTGACVAVAPLGASFFDEPELEQLLPILGLNFTIRALGSTHYALAQRGIDFRSRTAGELADVVVRGATGIGAALAGAGAYSLIIGYLAGSLAMTIVLWFAVPWRPTLRPSMSHLGELLRFGGALTALSIVAAVITLADYVFIGKVLGATAVGIYTLGFRLPDLMILNLSHVAGQVLYPVFAKVDPGRLGQAFVTSLHYTLIVAVPIAVGLFVLAEPVILALFGDKWEQSAPVMEIIALYALAATIGIPAGTAYKATGRVYILLVLAVPRAALVVVSIALFVDEGLIAVATCQAVAAALFDLIGIALATRFLSVAPSALIRAALPSVIAAAGMAAALVLLERAALDPWPTLIAGVAVGGSVYLGLLAVVARDSLRHLLRLALPERRPNPQEIAP